MTAACLAREAFLRGVTRSAVEHTLRLMAAHDYPLWAAALVARSEMEIMLRLMEVDA